MTEFLDRYDQALNYIKTKTDFCPEIGIILGSGLGGLASSLDQTAQLNYSEIPGFVCSTAPNHEGKLLFGFLSGKKTVLMKGRFHFYEGHAREDIIFPIRIMKMLGVKLLIVTNAAGGINTAFKVGDIMQIYDHINFTGQNPLIGQNDARFGERFFDMSHAYSEKYFSLTQGVAEKIGINLQSGIYLGCSGPSFETPAEIRAFRLLGADTVGMSTVFEVIAASQMKMEVMGFSLITNPAAGVCDRPLSGDDVIAEGKKGGVKLQRLIEEILNEVNL